MKNILLSLILLTLISIALSPALVTAINVTSVPQSDDLEDAIRDNLLPIKNVYDPINSVTPSTLQEIIAKFIRQLLAFLGVLFIALILYGGVTWMTSAGAEDKITKAKKIILASIVGLVIVLAAYAIAYFVTTQILVATGTGF